MTAMDVDTKAVKSEAKITTEMLPKVNPEDLIIPPPELKSIIEVTVGYVVRNGLPFEGELRKRQQSSRKFDFLIPGNPYYKWYKWKLACAIDPKAAEEAQRLAEQEKEDEQELKDVKKKEMELAKRSVKVVKLTLKQKIEQDMKLHKKVKEEYKQLVPEPKYYVPLPSHMTQSDVDLIKMTAQFVARNGRTFLNALSSQAQSSGSLSQRYLFLNPIDPRFPYFQKLVTAYNECIVVQNDTMNQLRADLDLDHLYYEAIGAAEMTVIEEKKRKMMDENLKTVTMEMKLIDWQDFQVVETITFDEENEYYPAPGKDIKEINKILDMESRKEINVVLADDVESDMEVDMALGGDSSEEEEEEIVEAPPVTQVQTIPEPAPAEKKQKPPTLKRSDDTIMTVDVSRSIQLESEENRKLRMMLEKDLFGGNKSEALGKYTKCPVTGVMVETKNLSEHIRISLLDPKWKQQKDALLGRMQVSSLAEDRDIVSNLSKFQTKHAAQFGVQEETSGKGSADSAPDEARLREAREQQRLRKAAQAGLGSAGSSKRRKVELIPEGQFLASHRTPQKILIKVPAGQGVMKTLEVVVPVSETVEGVKSQIQRSIGVGKANQVLQSEYGELENNRTLAFYNLSAGVELTLSVR